jgi:hypothetical protein
MKLDIEAIVSLLMLVIAFGIMGWAPDIERYMQHESNSQIASIGYE